MTRPDQPHRSTPVRHLSAETPVAARQPATGKTTLMYITGHRRHRRTDTATTPNSADSTSDYRQRRRQKGVDSTRRPSALTAVVGGDLDGE